VSTKQSGRVASRKDLHEGRSLWHDSTGRRVRTRPIIRDEACEIVIVGGGISGALTTLSLASDGHDVVVIDRRAPGEGSTIASTAMIQFEIDTPLTTLATQIGKSKATRAYRRSAKAVQDLGRIIAKHRLKADWVERDALFLAGNEMGYRGLQSEVDARQAIALPSQYLSKKELRARFGIERTGAIISQGSAELDPAKTSASALRAAQALGARIISPCTVVQVASDGKHVRLTTAEGPVITCRKAVFATGYEVIGGIPRDAFDIVSSWAIATKPIAPGRFWPTRCLIWEAADPYLYLRATADNRILAGGEDSGLTDAKRREAAIPAKSEKLIRKVRQLLAMPDLEIDYAWAGAFADSPTGLPVFKELPDLPGVFAILGCGGNGITFSVIAADVVKAWVTGRRDPDADLFVGL
jgi:glycine/D-amino acid oxidase-like deaminating enzyme